MGKIKLLLLALLFAVIPTHLWGYTKEQIVPFGNYYYKVLTVTPSHTLMLVGVKETFSGNLVVPATFNDGAGTTFTVTEIGADNSCDYKNVTSVQLSETIVALGPSSFKNANLSKVFIPKNVADISNTAWVSLPKNPECEVDAANPYFDSDANGVLYTEGKKDLRSVPSNILSKTGGTSYAIDAAVTSINHNAFTTVPNLKKVVLPPNLKSVKEGWPSITTLRDLEEFEIAPGGNTNYEVKDGVLFTKGLLRLVNYPQAKKVSNYVVPVGVKEIASYAIASNPYMTSIDFNQVTKINVSALISLGGLKRLTIPKDLKQTGLAEGAFEACQAIEAYEVAAGNTDFAAEDGVLFSANKETLYFYPLAKPQTSYTIPSSVKTIGVKSFKDARKLTALIIPTNVEYINEQAFRSIHNLTAVKFLEKSKLKKINNYVFWQCARLKEVTLPTSITEIGKAFIQCDSLETINVPDGSMLTTIGDDAFSSNRRLKHFNFEGTSQLTTIKKNAFANLTRIESFNMPKTVANIELNAFSGCSKLAQVSFDADAVIKVIGAGSFADCGLQNFTVPANVQKIEREAFRNCAALATINVSEATTDISPEAFKYCNNLTAINVSKKSTTYSSVDGYLLSKDKKTLLIFPPGKANEQFTLLPPSITAIGDYAFLDCKKLKNVTIPNLVTSIGKRAFGLCSNLNTITFLCDEKIKADSINQKPSERSFDDGTEAPDMFANINIQVRKEKLDDYKNDAFYQKFHTISPSFQDGTEEYIAVSDNAVDLLSTTSTDHTFVLPTSVHNGGKDYNVSLIGDYAFQHVTSAMKEVVVKKDVQYIGAKAFMTNIHANTSTIQSVFFIESKPTKEMLSTTRFELDETNTNYNEFAQTTAIYVKRSALDTYKSAWKKTVYSQATAGEVESPFDFTAQLDYRIKDVNIKKKYGTFAREFDVDLSIYKTEQGNTDIAAFVSKIGDVKQGNGDYGTSTYHVRMSSVDLNGGRSGSHGYVPANTGVLLKVLDKEATPADFYYAIGEYDDAAYNIADNIMKGVVVNPAVVQATSASPVYVMQGGQFKKATTAINPFTIHRAYATIGSLPAGAKVDFHYSDLDTTTGISAVGAPSSVDNVFYNLNGQRVSNPQRGVFIQGGRKVIIK